MGCQRARPARQRRRSADCRAGAGRFTQRPGRQDRLWSQALCRNHVERSDVRVGRQHARSARRQNRRSLSAAAGARECI